MKMKTNLTLIFLLCTSLTGCMAKISGDDLKWATEVCEPYKGVAWVTNDTSFSDYPGVKCNTGVLIIRESN